MAFPASPSNNQVHKEGNRSFVYDSTLGVWDQVKDSSFRLSSEAFSLPHSPSYSVEGAMYYDGVDNAVKVRTASAWKKIGFHETGSSATGGIIESYASAGASYIVHTFVTSGVFTLTSSKTVDCLVIGGGAGGGSTSQGSCGGGGGAGGVIYSGYLLLKSGTYTITVGAGGAQRTSNGHGYAGNHSFFAQGVSGVELKGFGGGGGAAYATGYDVGDNGGSGGGSENNAGTSSSTQTSHNSGVGYGTAGGAGIVHPYYNSGGGGGAGAAGSAGVSGGAGAGGNGKAFTITGASVTYAGGGGGGAYVGSAAAGGSGGAGAGGNASGTSGGAATGNTGSGGGGGGKHAVGDHYGGAGGSGIVIIRYAL